MFFKKENFKWGFKRRQNNYVNFFICVYTHEISKLNHAYRQLKGKRAYMCMQLTSNYTL